MQSSPLRLVAALLTALASGSSPAAAHAIIVAAEPAVDAVLHSPNAPVRLRFNSRIDHERSRLMLVRPDGTTAPLAISSATSPDLLAAEIKGLAPGHYRLRWQVLAVDGHITRGDIPFAVAP